MATHMSPEGRRLVAGDHQFEVAGQVRRFNVPRGEDSYLVLDAAVIRVWCQRTQVFVAIAITESGRVIGEARAGTYKECLDILRQHIEE